MKVKEIRTRVVRWRGKTFKLYHLTFAYIQWIH